MASDIKLVIKNGWLLVFYVFEIGDEVDLDRAGKIITTDADRLQFKARKGDPFFGLKPPPLVLRQTSREYRIGDLPSHGTVIIRVWPFGAMSFEYRIPLPHDFSLQSLVDLRLKFAEEGGGEQFELDAGERVQRVIDTFGMLLRILVCQR